MNKKIGRMLEPGIHLCFFTLIVFAAFSAVFRMYYLALAELGVTLLLYIYTRIVMSRNHREIMKYIETAAHNTDSASSLENLPFPMAVIRLGTDEIIWDNEQFKQITQPRDRLFDARITDLVPGFSTRWLADGKNQSPADVEINQRRYQVYGTLIRSSEEGRPTLLATTYWTDVTELMDIRDEYRLSRPVVAIILIDNYDEITKNLTDTIKSTILAGVDDRINTWTEGCEGMLRKTERDRYVFIFEERYMEGILDGKFVLLESVREVVNPSGLAATVSIGVGKDGLSFRENYQNAALSIEMSLSRGGDQAVVKDRFNFSFYGGKSRETERRTKVKSRVMANSLSELIAESSQVFIMGHKNADIDAIGAAAGVACISRKKGRRAYIIVDLQNNAANALISRLKGLDEYAGAFINDQDALLLLDNNTLLVVVDTNRPDQVESKELLLSCGRIAVIDHHRRAADYIENVTLNFHEPFASSASELVTELLQYVVEQQDILRAEAEALLAGIVLDTKSFGVRTGGRTFDAAAFLRRAGADTVDVKRLFQNDLKGTISRYQIIQTARLYKDEIAIAALDKPADRTIAAQAADELLNISGISTSFVMYPDGDRVIISARSIGDANVQMILEPLGGGGNAATAGAQVPDVKVTEALTRLVASIDRYYEDE